MPLRNLHIEVRQQTGSDQQGLRNETQVGVQWGGPAPQLQVQGQLDQHKRSSQASVAQQVLVLNGRSAAVALRSSVPWRVLQSVVRHGVLTHTRSVLLLEVGSGFSVTPRWQGDAQVEVELSAQQAAPAHSPGAAGSATSSTLVLPLDEWVTVAEAEASQQSSNSSLLGQVNATLQHNSRLQMRVRLR